MADQLPYVRFKMEADDYCWWKESSFVSSSFSRTCILEDLIEKGSRTFLVPYARYGHFSRWPVGRHFWLTMSDEVKNFVASDLSKEEEALILTSVKSHYRHHTMVLLPEMRVLIEGGHVSCFLWSYENADDFFSCCAPATRSWISRMSDQDFYSYNPVGFAQTMFFEDLVRRRLLAVPKDEVLPCVPPLPIISPGHPVETELDRQLSSTKGAGVWSPDRECFENDVNWVPSERKPVSEKYGRIENGFTLGVPFDPVPKEVKNLELMGYLRSGLNYVGHIYQLLVEEESVVLVHLNNLVSVSFRGDPRQIEMVVNDWLRRIALFTCVMINLVKVSDFVDPASSITTMDVEFHQSALYPKDLLYYGTHWQPYNCFAVDLCTGCDWNHKSDCPCVLPRTLNKCQLNSVDVSLSLMAQDLPYDLKKLLFDFYLRLDYFSPDPLVLPSHRIGVLSRDVVIKKGLKNFVTHAPFVVDTWYPTSQCNQDPFDRDDSIGVYLEDDREYFIRLTTGAPCHKFDSSYQQYCVVFNKHNVVVPGVDKKIVVFVLPNLEFNHCQSNYWFVSIADQFGLVGWFQVPFGASHGRKVTYEKTDIDYSYRDTSYNYCRTYFSHKKMIDPNNKGRLFLSSLPSAYDAGWDSDTDDSSSVLYGDKHGHLPFEESDYAALDPDVACDYRLYLESNDWRIYPSEKEKLPDSMEVSSEDSFEEMEP